nr:cyclopropane-fatty-acyl-phospholipid synthase family protein [Tomitella fengzijianii]
MTAETADGGTVTVPQAPRSLRARVAAPVVSLLFRRIARRLAAQGTPIRIELPDGTVIGDAAEPSPELPPAPRMILHDPTAFARRVGADGLIGFGEAYMAGDWASPDLDAVLTRLATRMTDLVPPRLQGLRRLYVRARPQRERNTAENARRNVAQHYDLSNDFFALFLDGTMTYSSGLFGAPGEPGSASGEAGTHATAAPATAAPASATAAPATVTAPPVPDPPPGWIDLAAAQRVKIDRLLDAAGVGPGTRLLEIGTGWGELCIRAAARGASVRSVTLSEEQQAEASSRVRAAGYADRVRIDLCDYRAVDGRYDAIVSVEMIEAVGHEYWTGYFRAVDGLLAPGGRFALQAITMPHDRMLRTRDTYTWIQKYIFPGGFLPSAQAIESVARRNTGLRVRESMSFGPHYAHTLRLWDRRSQTHSRRIAALGFDRTFRRMWHFYLCYSEAGFRSGYLDVQQIVLDRPGEHTAAARCGGPDGESG